MMKNAFLKKYINSHNSNADLPYINDMTATKEDVCIVYPVGRQIITSETYTMKIYTCVSVQKVDLLIDETEWKSCRESGGFWWFDWFGYSSKEYTLQAYATLTDETKRSSSIIKFSVNRR
jgi:hypothetical protein